MMAKTETRVKKSDEISGNECIWNDKTTCPPLTRIYRKRAIDERIKGKDDGGILGNVLGNVSGQLNQEFMVLPAFCSLCPYLPKRSEAKE